jgi:hypothetical protein
MKPSCLATELTDYTINVSASSIIDYDIVLVNPSDTVSLSTGV